jgi:cell division protein FtsN
VPAAAQGPLSSDSQEPPDAQVTQNALRNAEIKQDISPVKSPKPTEIKLSPPPTVTAPHSLPSALKQSVASQVCKKPKHVFLQVGSFFSRDNALRLQQRIREQLTDNVRIVDQHGIKGTVYKVSVGPLENLTEADRTSLELNAFGVRDSLPIVSR